MAYPPPQGNFSYQRAYPPNYGQDPYPPPIGFQNYIGTAPSVGPSAQPSQTTPYPPPPATVAYHGTPEPPRQRLSGGNSQNDVPEVGFERFAKKPNPPSAQSSSGVELENVEDLPHDVEQSSDNSATNFEACILSLFLLKFVKIKYLFERFKVE